MREELDKILLDFINEVTANDLAGMVKWTNSEKTVSEKNMWVCLIHLFNHETYHKGMVSLYLDMMEKENDYSNLYPYG